jgi:hypothetical protein
MILRVALIGANSSGFLTQRRPIMARGRKGRHKVGKKSKGKVKIHPAHAMKAMKKRGRRKRG